MINRDKYAEYLDSALIHKLINELDPKLSKKIFSLRFHPPFLASGQRFFDSSYKKEGIFIVRDKITGEFIRTGHAHFDVKKIMYNYIRRLPNSIKQNCDCAILSTYNGEQKEISILLSKVIKFELEYHNYFLLRKEIEEDSKIVDIFKLERYYPYTGRESLVFRGGKEWSLSFKKMISGVYLIWKDDEIDYIGKGKELVKRLYSHFADKSKYKEMYSNGKEYSHRHVYYPPEEVEQGRIKIAIIPVYRKVVSDNIPWQENSSENFRAENDHEFSGRISDLEKRLISFYKPPMNIQWVQEDDDFTDNEKTSNQEKYDDMQINSEDAEDPPF